MRTESLAEAIALEFVEDSTDDLRGAYEDLRDSRDPIDNMAAELLGIELDARG